MEAVNNGINTYYINFINKYIKGVQVIHKTFKLKSCFLTVEKEMRFIRTQERECRRDVICIRTHPLLLKP